MAWGQYGARDTAQNKAAAQEEIKGLCTALVHGISNLRNTNEYVDYLTSMSKFPRYSYRNVLLIATQRPDATLVNSYSGWQRLNRHINKGEKGIRILSPLVYKEYRPVSGAEVQAADETEREVLELVAGFKASSVFDISQTSGAPLPTLAYEGKGEHAVEYLFDVLASISGCEVSFGTPSQARMGECDPAGKSILIRSDLSDEQCVSTLVHEIAHCRLSPDTDHDLREVQAQSIAYVVSRHFGIEAPDMLFASMQPWDRITPGDLRDTLRTVSQESGSLITFAEKDMTRQYGRSMPEHNGPAAQRRSGGYDR